MLKRMLGPMVMERARRGWMLTSSVKYKFIWTTLNPNCLENSIPKFQTAGSDVPLLCWLSSPIMELFLWLPQTWHQQISDQYWGVQLLGIIISDSVRKQLPGWISKTDLGPRQGVEGLRLRGWRTGSFKKLASSWETKLFALTGRGEKGWRHWQLRPSTWPRIPTLWGSVKNT